MVRRRSTERPAVAMPGDFRYGHSAIRGRRRAGREATSAQALYGLRRTLS
ncbi:MAG: hypothetical protein LBL42_03255 [Tannerella sp.]|nr:hypothetical protein [Tannerella sp.]